MIYVSTISLSDCCHDLLMTFIDIDSIGILNIYGVDYRCIIVEITKKEAINVL